MEGLLLVILFVMLFDCVLTKNTDASFVYNWNMPMKVNVKNDKFQRNGKFPVSPSINKQKNIVIFKFYPLDLKHRIDRRFNKFSVI